MTYTPCTTVAYGDSMNLDAFSRLRISSPVGLFDAQCQYDANPFLLEGGATGTGVAPAHSTSTRMVALSATAGSGTSFVQSYEYIPYQAGKSQLAFATGVIGAAVANVTVDLGIFDSANGIFLRQNGTSGLQLIRRTSASGSVVDNAVAQSSWNLDKLDGTGVSGVTFDVTKALILVIDAQFLGMGRVRVGVDIGGVILPIHEFLNANVLTTPYMQTLTLPVQMLVTATSSGGTKTAYFKCASVSSEGGFENPSAYTFGTVSQSVTAASGARTHILSVRPATTFATLTNRSRLQITSLEVLVTGANPVLWELCIGATFTVAPTWSAVSSGNSAAEQTTAVGTLNAAGIVIASGYISATASNKQSIAKDIASKFPMTLDRAGAQRANGTYSLIVTGVGGNSATNAAMNLSELR